jgi:hypothetical protein
VAPVHRSGWRKADVLLWRPAPSTLFLARGSNNHCAALCRHGRAGHPLVGVAWAVHYLLILSFRQRRIVLSCHRSGPSPHEEGFWSLAVYHRSSHEAPPHEGLPSRALVFIALLGQSWAVEVAQEQVDRDTPISSTPTVAPGSLAHERALSRERRVRGPQ